MNLFASIIKMTCPRCRKGEMFLKPMKISRPLEMHKRCERCGQHFEPEAGFYYGAMFISYIFIAFISLSGVGLLVFVFNVSVNLSFGILLTFLAIIFFWNLRFARSLWIHLMVKYNPRAADDYIKNVSDPKTD